MTTRSHFMLISAAVMCAGLAVAPALAADDMAKPGTTSSDKTTKPDTMGKTDSMAKPGEKTDAMKKSDGMSDKKDGMTDPMKK